MKLTISRWLLFGLLLLVAGFVHAEGECPPGMFPTNPPGAQGPVGCAPIPGYNNNQQQKQFRPPPPQWESRWGAIATDFAHHSAGAGAGSAVDKLSKSEAELAAVAECQSNGGSNCKIEVAYDNECAAMVVGDEIHSATADTTIEKAIQSSMKTCRGADINCHVYYSACSLPIRIQ
jgi:hypothetical protein